VVLRTDKRRDGSAEGPVLCRLSYRDALGEESSIVVADRTIRIGRSPDCDLVLGHESVSREHAEIARNEDGWTIADLGSKNGLKVNTYKTRSQQLRDGDCVDIGAIKLWVDIGPMAQTGRARVVWKPEDHHQPAEVLDMDRLDSLFMSTPDLSLSLSPLIPSARSEEDGPETPRPDSDSLEMPVSLEEPAGLLGVFSQAAEALLTCDTLDETLERILELVFDNLTAERGVICLYDEETDTTEPKVMRTREGIPDEPIVISTHIANDCIKRRQSLLVRDANVDARFGGAESIIAMCIHSAMCAPLYREGRVVGFIYVDQQSELQPFTAGQLQTLSTVAILSAVAVEQAALRDRVREEQQIRDRLARYSSPGVVERIIQAPGVAERGMVAEEGDVTVLFADITGFTTLAEELPPREVIGVLNHIFERLTEEVFALEGTLDKFRGDGMMAFFGAPLPMPDHAARAVECALRMQDRLAELNAESEAHRHVAMRIGINSGPVVVGDIGSPQRKDYTVIGDVVNTASRLESAVAAPGQVVIGHSTWQRVRTRFECQALDEVFVKGKSQRVRPHLAIRRLP
jgi:adenylate cyclase